ncbi:MAG: glycosyltransferase, partial [Planctomycetota bacterium]
MDSMHALPRRYPHWSAVRAVSRPQGAVLAGIFVLVAACFCLDWLATLVVLNGLFIAFYLATLAFRACLMVLSVRSRRELEFRRADLATLADLELPIYTILVPLHGEAASLPGLLDALRAIAYPKEKLDVLLLLEEDDQGIRRAVDLMDLPRYARTVVVPEGQLTTEPAARNLGLALAQGDFFVVYGAGDRPDPDQLKKAVLGFRECDEDVICLQARLDVHNRRRNLLTRWSTVDCCVRSGLFLPGLDRLDVPMPLGGTSNHFKVADLRALLGWDPYNAAADCDLGVRLALRGNRTRMMDS